MSEHETELTYSLKDFIGQDNVVESIKAGIQFSKARKEVLDHILIGGIKGSGKNTLALSIAHELETNIRVTSFYAIKNASDFAAILTNLSEGDILLIENFDAIKLDCIDLLSDAMDSFCINVIIGKGPSSRSIRLPLPSFTLIASTEALDKVPKEIRSCFARIVSLHEYTVDELKQLILKHAAEMQISVDEEGAELLANYANGSHRKVVNALKRARDFAIVKNAGVVNQEIATQAIEMISEFD